MDAARLKRYIRTAPTAPGVYVWRGQGRLPVYIGKATNLRSRLSSYLRTADDRIRMMVQEARTLDWETTETDIEALILESQRIKERRPKYNVVMRDDKQYFHVAVTDEQFPQIILTHQQSSPKLKRPVAELIGPFTDGVPLKATLRVLRNIFPTCSCKQKHHIRCLNAHIGKCPGYCCLKSPASKAQLAEYRRNVRAVRDILTGRRANVIGRIAKSDPETALRVLRVFRNAQINARHARIAAEHHGALAALREAFRLADEPRRIEAYDVANIQGKLAVGAMAVFTDGRSDAQEYRRFNIRTDSGGDTAMLAEMLRRRIAHEEWTLPDLVLVDGGKAQLSVVRAVLADAGLSVPVLALTKDDRHRGDHVFSSLDGTARKLADLERPVRDLLLHADQEAHRFSITNYRHRHRTSLVE